MILVKGVTSFLSTKLSPKSTTFMKNKRVNLQITEISKPFTTACGTQSVVITCLFTAFIDEHYECKSLEDYNGKVKPFLQNHIKNTINRVEIHYMNYAKKR